MLIKLDIRRILKQNLTSFALKMSTIDNILYL